MKGSREYRARLRLSAAGLAFAIALSPLSGTVSAWAATSGAPAAAATGGGVRAAADADSDIAGAVALTTPGSASGSLDPVADRDDVYRVSVSSAGRLVIELSGAAGTDFDVYVYGPGTTTVGGSEPYETYSRTAGTSDEVLSITSAYRGAGEYYIDVFADPASPGAKAGTYTLKVTPDGDGELPGLQALAPAWTWAGDSVSQPYDAHDVRRVRVEAGQTFRARVDSPVDVLMALYGPGSASIDDSRARVASGVAISSGASVLQYTAPVSGDYYLDVHARPSLPHGVGRSYRLNTTTSRIAGTVSIRSSASAVRLGRSFTLTGVLTPGDAGDPVVVYVKKPRKSYWSYSSKRLCYSNTAGAGANWWYRYALVGRTSTRGLYYFKTGFAGDSMRSGAVSPAITVRVW